MLALHIVLLVLLSVSLAFAIVELGLSAYVATFWGRSYKEYYWDPYEGYVYKTVHESTPGILIFIIFSACWTILAVVAALVLPWFYARKGFVSTTLNTILGIGFTVVYFVTSVFWLACFADIESLLGGATSSNDYLNAVIAFAILLWLIFLALFILAILALCGVLAAEWVGYQPMRKRGVPVAPQTTEAPVVQAHDGPMSTTPVAPSELSTRDAEALHNQQPTTQAHNASSPTAHASAELSGDSSVHHGHQQTVDH
ncbi:hypothetical protein N7462_000063 [Penicillium macrosclerotiorum]|uniref:uncharacterized protein n=1 Tax=Penicillium macrosclerotiorum TaxID=303699 RepID=UPI002546DE77|nr:uncharacterized protein N7462_000063 [Penicillium macrosclerotiorum]KAJ5698058.1 hypothetical protein N7462_000063 [Penicillium macrosclerotiorum]